MAGAKQFGLGNDAFVDEEYGLAKEKYSEAISLEPENSSYYLKRSICHAKLEDYASSASDAEQSIKLDANNPKAHLRLGIAKFHLKEYKSSKEAFQSLSALDAENKEAVDWIKKCDAEIAANNAGNTESKVTNEAVASEKNMEEKHAAANSVKHDWYQTETNVVLTLMVKNRKKEDVEVEFGKQNVSIAVKLSSSQDYNWELNLAHPIVPQDCITRILSTKIEVKMKKTEGMRWNSLENKNEPVFAKLDKDSATNESSTRQYPTSSKRHQDWDKLAAKIEKDETEDKKEGEAALNELFQKIYANADEDTKRAMNKSFQESGGTVLSTNWKDIGAKKVDCKPPDGMEFKKYEF
ncbi:protein SGT1 homolog [Rhopilema esculentum]|uniref:protein SGT1 homolog n=1 Tax=Rhopilema esculentum TaxID=499914 RepID=UPI0031D5A152|eukprot:gene472-10149_t